MSKAPTVIVTTVITFGMGFAVAGGFGGSDSHDDVSPALNIPVALQRTWFPPISDYDTGGQPLAAERFDELMARLEVALTAEETLADFGRELPAHLDSFLRRLAVPRVTDEQKERVRSYLDALAEQHPDHRSTIEQQVRMLDFYDGTMPSPPPSSSIQWLAMEAFGSGNDGEPFEDAEVDQLLAILDVILSLPLVAADIESESDLTFWYFTKSVQSGQLNQEQTAGIGTYLDELRDKHPGASAFLDRRQFILENLTPGNVAPNIVGTDTEGVDFALADYRGKVVVLVFSGQWCAPCREEYPYQRAMLDLYDEEDVVLLGINSDAKLETAQQAKIDEGLLYRTWWDGHSQPDAVLTATNGPIATAWGVRGWPQTYVLDEAGVIRYVDKGKGELIAVVDQVLSQKQAREMEAQWLAAATEARAEDAENEGDREPD